MKNILFILILAFTAITASSHSDYESTKRENRYLKKEIKELRADVRRLEGLILNLMDMVEHKPRHDRGHKKQWACYMNDMRAGGIYGTGSSEAEAKGKTLQSCTKNGGVCFSSDLKCSKSD
ncbi:hypothetical protein [Pleionea sediminis]|uniref:hypothetical protein n=1 Tax=Pleionea sediminis TaxID=2569479 RepID=UPI001185C15A|nr:hypothetical protein [Pleionea sediminis]